MNRIIFAVLVSIMSVPLFAAEPKLHAFFYVDTDAGQVGADVSEGCKNNRKLFNKILKEIFIGKTERLAITNIDAEDARAVGQILWSKKKKTPIEEKDTLWFHYCGHGSFRWNDGHIFSTSKGEIQRSDLMKALRLLGGHLTILTSDACSSLDPTSSALGRNIPASWDAFNHLFFLHDGVVDITAAQPLEVAWGTNIHGGYFGKTLGSLLCEKIEKIDLDKDGFASWEEAAHYLQSETNDLFISDRATDRIVDPDSEFAKTTTVQTPYMFTLARPIKTLPSRQFQKEIHFTNNSSEDVLVHASYEMLSSGNWTWLPRDDKELTLKVPAKTTKPLTALGLHLTGRKVRFRVTSEMPLLWPSHEVRISPDEGYLAKMNQIAKIGFSTKPQVSKIQSRAFHDAFFKGKHGILVAMSFVATDLKDVNLSVTSIFYDKNGKPLSRSGKPIVGTVMVRPQQAHEVYGTEAWDLIQIFVPYSAFDGIDSLNDIQYRLDFWSAELPFAIERSEFFPARFQDKH